MYGQPDPIPLLHRQDEAYIVGKGWKCNPIANEVVTAVRHRWVSDWDETRLAPGERIPADVMKRMGITYGEEES